MDRVLKDLDGIEVGNMSGYSMNLQFIADAGFDILNHKTLDDFTIQLWWPCKFTHHIDHLHHLHS